MATNTRRAGPDQGAFKPPLRLVAIAVAIVVAAWVAFAALEVIVKSRLNR